MAVPKLSKLVIWLAVCRQDRTCKNCKRKNHLPSTSMYHYTLTKKALFKYVQRCSNARNYLFKRIGASVLYASFRC